MGVYLNAWMRAGRRGGGEEHMADGAHAAGEESEGIESSAEFKRCMEYIDEVRCRSCSEPLWVLISRQGTSGYGQIWSAAQVHGREWGGLSCLPGQKESWGL